MSDPTTQRLELFKFAKYHVLSILSILGIWGTEKTYDWKKLSETVQFCCCLWTELRFDPASEMRNFIRSVNLYHYDQTYIKDCKH